jgi:hypothetical protein
MKYKTYQERQEEQDNQILRRWAKALATGITEGERRINEEAIYHGAKKPNQAIEAN